MDDEEHIPQMQPHEFICPHCGKMTIVMSPMDYIFAKRVTCNECGKEFLIENDKPKHLPQ